jgi:DUF971 family protein
VDWIDGHMSRLPHDILRGYCPCASCQGHQGTIRYVEGGDLDLVDIEHVGIYALRFEWADRHGTGIYSFAYLRHLGDLVDAHGVALPTTHPELPRLPPSG